MNDASLFPVYSRAEPVFSHEEGSRLFRTDGINYIDCVGGIATNALGHAHPTLVAALKTQAGKLWHLSNMFRIPGQEELARKLVEASFADRLFFTNSGTEARELGARPKPSERACNPLPISTPRSLERSGARGC